MKSTALRGSSVAGSFFSRKLRSSLHCLGGMRSNRSTTSTPGAPLRSSLSSHRTDRSGWRPIFLAVSRTSLTAEVTTTSSGRLRFRTLCSALRAARSRSKDSRRSRSSDGARNSSESHAWISSSEVATSPGITTWSCEWCQETCEKLMGTGSLRNLVWYLRRCDRRVYRHTFTSSASPCSRMPSMSSVSFGLLSFSYSSVRRSLFSASWKPTPRSFPSWP
mmetsp:Transcript_29938/g.73667  ORF Transcript_29938/g.73667 Transcript_29938/m.73667 type:complete len:220 (+) Transcript_29938:707-1366(+)